MRRILALIFAVYVGFGLGLMAAVRSPAAWATSFVEQPFPETVGSAPVIVRGTIGASRADWGKETTGSRRIYTYWDLKLTETLKGAVGAEPGATIQIREMGGEKDGMGMQVSGAAHFDAGEDVVVFLGEKNAESSHDVWGMMMGKYGIKKAADGSEQLIGPGLSGEDAHGQQNAPKPATWTLASLRELIASQPSTPMPSASASPAPEGSPSPTASTEPSPAAPSADPSPAPQLQPSAPEDPVDPSGLWMWPISVFGLILGIAAILLFFPSKKRSGGPRR
jgi:hypothetical protein